MMYNIKKINTRLHIVNSHNESVYSPPDFIREQMTGRQQLQNLADEFTMAGDRNIDAIMRFEAQFNVQDTNNNN